MAISPPTRMVISCRSVSSGCGRSARGIGRRRRRHHAAAAQARLAGARRWRHQPARRWRVRAAAWALGVLGSVVCGAAEGRCGALEAGGLGGGSALAWESAWAWAAAWDAALVWAWVSASAWAWERGRRSDRAHPGSGRCPRRRLEGDRPAALGQRRLSPDNARSTRSPKRSDSGTTTLPATAVTLVGALPCALLEANAEGERGRGGAVAGLHGAGSAARWAARPPWRR